MPKPLARELEALGKQLLTLGARVEEAINKAITALLERRPELAREVVEGDTLIDEYELEVEQECVRILALHQPVAGDLRFVMTVLKVNNDLERMGDHAANIASRARYLSTRDSIEAAEDLADMAIKVRRMVSMSIDALVTRNPGEAREVCLLDSEVDQAHKHMFTVVQDLMRDDPSTIERAVQSLSVSRHLERIADLATNIAQDLVYMVEGEVIRHRHPMDEDEE